MVAILVSLFGMFYFPFANEHLFLIRSSSMTGSRLRTGLLRLPYFASANPFHNSIYASFADVVLFSDFPNLHSILAVGMNDLPFIRSSFGWNSRATALLL